jgi:hypothetical protein
MEKGAPKFRGSYNCSLLSKSSQEKLWTKAEVGPSGGPGCNYPCALAQKEHSAKAVVFHWDSFDFCPLDETGSIG